MQERLAELVRGIFPAACIIWTGAARLPRLKCRGRCRGCEVEMSSVTQPISSGGCEASPSLACHCLAQAPSALARGSVVMRRPPQASSAAAQRDNGRSAWRCAWRAGRGRRLPCAQVFAPRRRQPTQLACGSAIARWCQWCRQPAPSLKAQSRAPELAARVVRSRMVRLKEARCQPTRDENIGFNSGQEKGAVLMAKNGLWSLAQPRGGRKIQMARNHEAPLA
jgi:hypothetical protein